LLVTIKDPVFVAKESKKSRFPSPSANVNGDPLEVRVINGILFFQKSTFNISNYLWNNGN
jgi:hypothetical protein